MVTIWFPHSPHTFIPVVFSLDSEVESKSRNNEITSLLLFYDF